DPEVVNLDDVRMREEPADARFLHEHLDDLFEAAARGIDAFDRDRPREPVGASRDPAPNDGHSALSERLDELVTAREHTTWTVIDGVEHGRLRIPGRPRMRRACFVGTQVV